jgi:hypothetical protein
MNTRISINSILFSSGNLPRRAGYFIFRQFAEGKSSIYLCRGFIYSLITPDILGSSKGVQNVSHVDHPPGADRIGGLRSGG